MQHRIGYLLKRPVGRPPHEVRRYASFTGPEAPPPERATFSGGSRIESLDLEQLKNLGEKSIDEITAALAPLGLSLGMRIDPNVLGSLGRGGVVR